MSESETRNMSEFSKMGWYYGEEKRIKIGVPKPGTVVRMYLESWSLSPGTLTFKEDGEIHSAVMPEGSTGRFIEVSRVTWPTGGAGDPVALIDFGGDIGRRWIATDTFYIVEGGSE